MGLPAPFASVHTKLHLPEGTGVLANALAATTDATAASHRMFFIDSSAVVESHRLANVAHRVVRHVGSLLAAVLDDIAHQRRILLVGHGALADGLELRVDRVDHRLLALE